MRKKRGVRKLICVGLVLAMTLGLCACGGESETDANAALAKEYVYSCQELELPDLGDDMSVSSVAKVNDRVYIVVEIYHWDDSSKNELKLMSMNADGTDVRTVNVEFPEKENTAEEGNEADVAEDVTADTAEKVVVEEVAEADTAVAYTVDAAADVIDDMSIGEEYYSQTYENTYYSNYVISNAGNLYATKNYYFEDYSDPENYISKQENYICAWDLEGNFLWEQPMENLQTEESYNYVRALLPSDDGSVTVLIGGDSDFRLDMDAEGNMSLRQALSNGTEILQQASDIIPKSDGTLLVSHYSEDWTAMYLTPYDVKTDTVGESSKLPDSFMWSGYNSMAAGVTTDIVYSNSSGIYGYNIGDEQPVQIMSYINSDINTSSISRFAMLDETHFVAFYYDRTDTTNKGGLFTKRNPEDIPDKKVLVLAGNYVPYDMKNRVVNFNKSSDAYRVVVKEYDSYNTMEDFTAGYTQLNNDIITGNMPDILVASSQLPIDNYIAKGLIADVGALIEQDEELSQVEFLENVFNAYSVDGTLYYVVPSFYVRTLVGKTSMLGDRDSWNMQEFLKFVDTLPEGTEAIGELTRSYFITMMMQFCGSDFVDVSTGKCNFNSQEFISMLEFAKTLPEELSEDYYGDNYWMNYQSQYREDRTVLMESYISTFRDMNYTLNGTFGEEVSFIGFPTESGSGAVIMDNECYVLSAKSKNLDGAWEFLRYYLTDEYQSTMDWGLPVSKEVFMERTKEGLGRPYYLDENGEKVEYDNYFTINGEDVILDPLTQEQIDQLTEVVMSAEKRYYYNEDILNIITEESAAFFEGQKNAEEVAQIIQSRAQIFVDENR